MEAGRSSQNGKIAIVGIGCRYGNGVDDVKKFWEMLVKGLDCTTPIPRDRFDATYFVSPGEKTPGKMYTQNGGYIAQDPYMFDRQFFKMPPDEAAHLDPQVRLLLEVTWEALENAGIPASSVRGTRTGVYMGVTAQEYSIFASKPYHNMNQYSNSGTNSCMVSNRISYEFDLRGPSFSVDTACSSSLYSIYLACDALRQRSCSLALAGGVNLILAPTATIGFCQAGMLSPDGKCKSFDKSADGYSRSEGAGVIVLKPLKAALRDGDRVYAVLRGGALSNDGKTPGIANPSFAAQIDLVKAACRNAGVHPHQIVYAEAHGTGTRVGDSTEAGALGEVLGKQRGLEHPPLYVGSVKSNVGHSEGAAGVAGVIKVALCLHQQKIPPVVHFKTPNENVDFEKLKIHIPTEVILWPSNGSSYLSCCSSFGFGGANANLVLESIKGPQKNGNRHGKPGDVHCLLLSAATSDALHQKLKDWVEFFSQEPKLVDANFHSYLYTAACRSEHHAHRVGFAVYSREDALSQLLLKLDAETQAQARCVDGVAPPASSTAKQIVFVFSGMGTQWWGMARELMRTQPVFASKIKVIDKLLQNCGAKWSLTSMLSDEKDRERVNQTDISQPCIYAVAMGLLELWKMRGITPDAVVGHSVGEIAAANAAGLLSTEDAVKIIYRRGRELRKTSGSGKMLAVLHPVQAALKLAKESKFGQLLDVAAFNSPTQVVLSGEGSAAEGFANELKMRDIKCVTLKVNNAFHSKQQEAVKGPFLKKVSKFLQVRNDATKRSTIPMMSTVTGRYLTPEEANSPDYWFSNIRQKVSFMDAVYNLAKDSYRVFVEIGSHAALLPALRDIFADFGELEGEGKIVSTPSLIRPKDTANTAKDSEILLLSQMRLHVNGIPMAFGSLFSPAFRRVLSVPHYPWQREKCTTITEDVWNDLLFPVKEGYHLLLGEERKTSQPSHGQVRTWHSNLNASRVPWVKDHVLQDAVVVPAAAYIETGLAAARAVIGKEYPLRLEALEFERFMFAPDAEGNLETTVEEKTAENILFTLRSRDTSRGTWTQHCQLRICSGSGQELDQSTKTGRIIDAESLLKKFEEVTNGEDFYNLALESGFRLGPTFRGITKAICAKGYMEALLFGKAPGSVEREFHRYVYHPAFMDSSLQAFVVLLHKLTQSEDELAGKTTRPMYRVPTSMESFSVFGPTPPRVLIHSQIRSAERLSCDIDVADAETHAVFCSVRGLVFETIRTDVGEPQIWSTSWNNHGFLKIEDTDPSPINPKTVVILANDQELCALLEADVETANVKTVVMNAAQLDCVQKTVDILSNTKDFETLLVIINTEGVSLNAGLVMSKATFEEHQEKGPLFCYSLIKALQAEEMKPNILLFTKGSYQAREGDAVDPFAASLTSFLMTLSQEDPSIRSFNVDLPMDASCAECAAIVREVIVNQDNYLHAENIVAVRHLAADGKQEKTWELLFPRLKMEGISKAPGIVATRDWSVGIENKSKQRRIVVERSTQQNRIDANVQKAHIKIDAFSVFKKSDSEDENESASIRFVYAGTIEGALVPRRWLGVIVADKVTPYVDVEPSDITVVPSYLTCAEAVAIVVKYFSAAVFFNQAVAITIGKNLLFKMDSVDSENLAAVHLATQMGAEVTALNDGIWEDLGSLKIHPKSLKEIPESSVDILFMSLRSTSLDRALHSIIPKLKRNATIVIMQKKKEETRLTTLPSNMKMVIFETSFPCAFEGLTAAEISQTLVNIFEGLDQNIRDIPHMNSPASPRQLSLFAAKNVEIPDGEVIKSSSEELLLPVSVAKDGFVANDKCSYLVTGGSKGFGLRLVEWLVSRGARYIYTSSRGETNKELRGIIERAEMVGTKVRHLQMDVSCAKDVEEGLREMISDEWPSLKGIVHCAAVYSDAFIQNTTVESWNVVMAPKAYGALLLHQITQRLNVKLDHFIMTSSIVSLIGNAGQGNYCAANVFLNALAQHRHEEGLPATALQIGLISDVGFAERGGLVQKWKKSGSESMSPKEVLGVIGCALSVHQPLLGITGPFDKKLYADSNGGLMMLHFQEKQGTLSMIKDLYEDSDAYLTVKDDSFQQSIMKLPFLKARETVMNTLVKLLCDKLAISGDVSPEASPLSLGLDSLMASEVSRLISQQFQVMVGAVELLNDKYTIKKLADKITKQMLMEVDSGTTGSSENGEIAPSKVGAFVIEGEAPTSAGVKLVCFPSTGAGPSIYSPWVKPLLKYNVHVLMIQIPGWEGREDERPHTDLHEITRLIHDELLPYISEGPFVFFGHSLGSLIAYEVAHRFMAEDNLFPRHLFVSSWYSPFAPYPHPKELENKDLIERLKDALNNQPKLYTGMLNFENISFSFLDESLLHNTAFMRKLLPSIKAVLEIISDYTHKHPEPLPCDVTVFGGKHDNFVQPHLLDGWQPCGSRKNTFKKVMMPGKHMHILTNTAEILKWICLACKHANGKQ